MIPQMRSEPPWLRNELWRRARQVPAFDIDANDGPLPIDKVSGLNLTTFTRTASATFVDSNGTIQTAGSNVLRRQWDATNRRWGWLVEEARTNLLLRSEEFDNASWVKAGWLAFGSGSTANATTAPNGTSTADLLTETASTVTQRVAYQTGIVTTSGTLSCFVKPNGRSFVGLRFYAATNNWVTAIYTLTGSGSAGSVAAGSSSDYSATSASVVPHANGWYRVSLTATRASGLSFASIDFATSANPVLVAASGAESYAGDGTSGIYLWGAQLEAGAFPTSYIPTTGTTATRDADVWSSTGAWYQQNEGTFRFEALNHNTSGAPIILRARNTADTAYRLDFSRSAATTRSQTFISDGTTQANMGAPGGSWPDNIFHTFASAYKVNDFSHVTAGSIVSDTSGTVPLNIDQWQIALVYTGLISRITYWPRRLPDSVLQELTR